MAILDWMMPGIDGTDLCRTLRAQEGRVPYLILLTSKDRREDIVSGSRLARRLPRQPFDPGELRARVRVGERPRPAAGAGRPRDRARRR